jgi:signal transduction histidine kinase
VSPGREAWRLLPGAVLAGLSAWAAAQSVGRNPVLDAAVAAVGVLLVWSVATAVRARYPQRPLGWLLCALAVLYALQPLIYSRHPLAFTLARAARPAAELMLIWVMLSFPTGRLVHRADRALLGAAAAAVLLLWLPGVMLSARVPPFGPFAACVPDCPDNPFFLVDRPQVSAALLQAFRAAGAVLLVLTSWRLLQRWRGSTPLMRRSLAPVALASVARTLNVAVFLATGAGLLAANFTLWAVPAAIALGLLRGRLYTARVLQRLVTGLRRQPDLGTLRRIMAEALDDAMLAIGTWRERDRCWVDERQQPLPLQALQAAGRTPRVLHDAAGAPVAVLVHDPALREEPLLLEAVLSSMSSALHAIQAERELAHERGRAADAAERERRRIERDLHDGAQQRLLALRLKLGVACRLFDNDARRARQLMREMDDDLDVAVRELREMAHGIVPPLLAERGLAAALAEAAAGAAIAVRTEIEDPGKLEPAIERAVYFCCLEALQNAAKHAGPSGRATLRIGREGSRLEFSVRDDGPGWPAGLATYGQGLQNIRERVSGVGGALHLEPASGGGAMLRCTVPLAS